MDSGLGSDEDRRGKTKEQKQLRNQQLLSGCFIDAASLSDDADVDQRRNDERRQGARIFESSIPQFSMLQMSGSDLDHSFSNNDSLADNFADTTTPYNSIVNFDSDESARKSPLGFYVDFNQVQDIPKSAPSNVKKNIFSMTIDFKAAKKEKPTTLSSYVSQRKNKITKQNGRLSDSLSGSGSSINSVPGPSREVGLPNAKTENNLFIVKSTSSVSSSNEDIVIENIENSDVLEQSSAECEQESIQDIKQSETLSTSNNSVGPKGEQRVQIHEEKNEVK
ncbi:hypothetical protein WA026_017467, partial [Henosepilachna vigintioctopunctata]